MSRGFRKFIAFFIRKRQKGGKLFQAKLLKKPGGIGNTASARSQHLSCKSAFQLLAAERAVLFKEPSFKFCLLLLRSDRKTAVENILRCQYSTAFYHSAAGKGTRRLLRLLVRQPCLLAESTQHRRRTAVKALMVLYRFFRLQRQDGTPPFHKYTAQPCSPRSCLSMFSTTISLISPREAQYSSTFHGSLV